MSSFWVKVKRSRGKKQQEETRNISMLLWQETIYLKVLQQKVFQITTESSLPSLTARVDGAAELLARNLPQREEFFATPLSSLPDYVWSQFQTPSVVTFLNKLFSVTISCCCLGKRRESENLRTFSQVSLQVFTKTELWSWMLEEIKQLKMTESMQLIQIININV